jgi:hypothetical protein
MAPDLIHHQPFGALPPFLRALPTDGMRSLLRHWAALREGAAMPRRPVFDPLRFPEMMPLMQLHERKGDGRYLCRVSGTEVVAASGYESTGRYLDEVVLPGHQASRTAIFDRSLEAGLPLLYDGRLMVQDRDWKRLQRLLLPLADRHGHPRFLLSLLHFERLQPVIQPLTDENHGILSLRMMTPAELASLG